MFPVSKGGGISWELEGEEAPVGRAAYGFGAGGASILVFKNSKTSISCTEANNSTGGGGKVEEELGGAMGCRVTPPQGTQGRGGKEVTWGPGRRTLVLG